MLKAIETTYKGYRFRSRLEARWAVFFDALGVPWEYEKEGYDLGEAGWYLPDFWLPRQHYWFEVKGQDPSKPEVAKAIALARQSRNHVFIAGNVGLYPIPMHTYEDAPVANTDVLNGTIRWFWPREDEQDDEHFVGLQWIENESIGFRIGTFAGDCIEDIHSMSGFSLYSPYSPRLMTAYELARSARFEHRNAA
jgi:hypothetical protein